jgi:hypothetical protein
MNSGPEKQKGVSPVFFIFEIMALFFLELRALSDVPV